MSNLYTHRSPCHLILFFTLFLSLSHLSPFHLPFTSSSPTPPPHLSISLNSSSSMGFSTLCLFISHGIFSHLFTSPIDCTLNLLFKLSITHCPNNWWCCAQIFFYPLRFYGGLCMKDAIFFLFCSLIRFVDFVICVTTRILVFIFIFFIGFMDSKPLFVVL